MQSHVYAAVIVYRTYQRGISMISTTSNDILNVQVSINNEHGRGLDLFYTQGRSFFLVDSKFDRDKYCHTYVTACSADFQKDIEYIWSILKKRNGGRSAFGTTHAGISWNTVASLKIRVIVDIDMLWLHVARDGAL